MIIKEFFRFEDYVGLKAWIVVCNLGILGGILDVTLII